MIRSLTTTALVGACIAAAPSQAAEVTFSGTVDAGMKADLNTFENSPKYLYNLEANLTADAKLSDAVSVQLYGTALTGAYGVPGSFGPGVDAGGNYDSRWPRFAFDGATITWKLDEASTLTFGDVVYAKGSISYYQMKRFSSVTRVAATRGIGYTNGGASFYAGANDAGDAGDSIFTLGGGYMATISEGNTVEPFGTIHLGMGNGDLPWGAGLQYKGTMGALSLGASAAGYGGKNAKDEQYVGYALLVEPTFTAGDFSLASTVVFAPKAEAIADGEWAGFAYPLRHGRSYSAWSDDFTVYVEPGVKISDVVATGLAVEYHEPDLGTEKDEAIWIIPNLYLTPAEGATITLWAEADIYTEDDKDMTYAAGMETIFKF